jgi:hypothetical protein
MMYYIVICMMCYIVICIFEQGLIYYIVIPTSIITLAELWREYAVGRALALLPDAWPATLWSTPEDPLQRLLAEST